ncbi:MAG: EAL domain-containing protein [Hahellaceae bacterium]|nr:EAL domain-containing protein [Hahellaceae bacterium]MCP5169371.1 EAL domain-containing protein [Hahellaceae bacterium]
MSTDPLARSKELNFLILDDSDDDVFVLVHTLKQAGLQFSYSHYDSLEALHSGLREQAWDIVISDHNLGSFTSSDVLDALGAYDADIPVIIVSGEIGEACAIKAMQKGARDFVMKDNLARLVPVILREYTHHELRKSQRHTEEQFHFYRHHDQLTRLLNRAEFERLIESTLESARLNRKTHTLMCLDIDQFKLINDTCGHIAGDDLLIRITQVLKAHIRNRDTLARLGGDEFGILLENCYVKEAMQTAENIRRAIQDFRFLWEEHPFEISLSIGMTEIDARSRDRQQVMSCADIACDAAKSRGRGCIMCFSPEDTEYHKRRNEMSWSPKIKQAAAENLFVLYHQPMANLQFDCGPHTEFLLRMKGEQRLIAPGEFIPAAERYNLMPTIDRWVVEHVFEFLSESGLGKKSDGTYFINLSGSTLSDAAFFDDIKRLQKKYAILPQRICFEITETAAINNLVDAVGFITEIRQRGFKFALDDFGVGLSTFTYLKTFPSDYLKIDGSFVLNMMKNPIDEGIVEACNKIAHAAGLYTIAEFVENEDILQAVKSIGVDFAQGYGIVKPAPLPTIRT